MANSPSSICRHPVWLCRTCGTDLENWPEVKAKLALSKEQERTFRQHQWTATDWMDFHCTLEAFKGRVLDRANGTAERGADK
jgi:hypothetical protein